MTHRRGSAAPPDWLEAHRTQAEPADLDDVIGLRAAKRELLALSTRLTNRHEQLAIPRGILLWGPPGCGKTLLARVLTNLLGGGTPVPMYEFRATELLKPGAFDRIGVALADRPDRVVVFIDEIDLFARRRDDERHTNQTRRTLYGALAMLDGLRRQDRIVWLLATSRSPGSLDEALLRAGRIDVRVEVEYPDLAEREALLTRYTRQLPQVGQLDLARAAVMLGHRKSPAAIAAVCQDGFALALGDGLDGLDWPHLAEAIRREGHVADDETSPEVAWRTAVHEAGHAIAACVLRLPVQNVTILARHGGRTDMEERKPRQQAETDNLISRSLIVKLAGLAAERLVFGEVSFGCESDIDGATEVALRRLDAGFEPAFGPINWWRIEKSKAAADDAFCLVQRYLRERFADAESLVDAHESAVRHFAATLLAERQLSGAPLETALAEALVEAPNEPNSVPPTVIADDYTAAVQVGPVEGRATR